MAHCGCAAREHAYADPAGFECVHAVRFVRLIKMRSKPNLEIRHARKRVMECAHVFQQVCVRVELSPQFPIQDTPFHLFRFDWHLNGHLVHARVQHSGQHFAHCSA
jgi:hypothetical protein